MKDEKETCADALRQVERLLDRLDKSGLPDLAHHVRVLSKLEKLEDAKRVPLGLFESGVNHRDKGDLVHVVIDPPLVRLVPEHLVLTREIAESYELFSFTTGCANNVVGSQAVPLETFAIDHYLDTPKLAEVQKWRCYDEIGLSTRATMVLRVVRGGAPPFRGIFWCRVVWG